MAHALRLAGFVLGCILLSKPAPAGEGFVIRSAELVPIGSDYVLNADIHYAFSATALEALDNSVPLTLAMNLRLERVRPRWWNETILDHRHQLQIRYHPLGQLFQLNVDDRGNKQSFTTLESLLDAMGSIRRLPVFATDKIVAGEQYVAELSVRLDIETLPLPLRPTAYLSPSWYLSSPTYRWSLAKSD
jgi:hypothetical protein